MAAKPQTARRGGFTWWHGLICGLLLAFAPGQALLLGTLLAPCIATLAVDMDADRGMTRAVALACTAAALAPAWHLWSAGNRLNVAFALLGNPMVLGLAWGAGAGAWALCQVLPATIESAWKAKEALRAHAITAEIERLREEWDVSE